MSARKAILPLALLLLLLAPVSHAVGGPSDTIIIGGADALWESIPASNVDLSTKLDEAGARVVLQFANGSLQQALTTPSSAFQPLLDAISAHVVVGYANGTIQEALTTPPPAFQPLLDAISAHVMVGYANGAIQKALTAAPPAFQTRLDQVAERVVYAFANASREHALSYPGALVNDNTPPQITALMAVGSGAISWITDEFATTTVRYGTQSGVYTETVTDPLYTTVHEVILTGLVVGTKYYYQVSSTDLSGNTTTSAEQTFTPQFHIYLPLTLRNK